MNPKKLKNVKLRMLTVGDWYKSTNNLRRTPKSLSNSYIIILILFQYEHVLLST